MDGAAQDAVEFAVRFRGATLVRQPTPVKRANSPANQLWESGRSVSLFDPASILPAVPRARRTLATTVGVGRSEKPLGVRAVLQL